MTQNYPEWWRRSHVLCVQYSRRNANATNSELGIATLHWVLSWRSSKKLTLCCSSEIINLLGERHLHFVEWHVGRWILSHNSDNPQGSFRWETPSPLLKSCRMHGNSVAIVRVFKNALWTALLAILWPKYTILHDFAYTVSKFFHGSYLRAPKEATPVLGHTPISASLASVPIVPVLRNDHC